ncbi:MAG TPA: N-acetyl-gamma-glutamyl-phosphate reductase [Dissulfurispiraceae bacterium]|nr:N-acetyl-gamma-glutamyl-phosphate reductase [Dissulfurispiraceae bacterium]
MIKVAICGGSGYTGAELLRMLRQHPEVEIAAVTSEKSAGKRVTDLFPHLVGYEHLVYEHLDRTELVQKADLFFLALPHAASQEAVDAFYRAGKKVIDLSADYRLQSPVIYEVWYKTPHHYPETLKKAVYGLPELYRKQVKRSRLIANPGCYPTSAVLALMPALKKGLIDPESIIVDSKSGTTGAGRKADIGVAFCEVNEGFKAYGIAAHRHTPEIEQEISKLAGKDVDINFTPHLVPMDRGILTTAYGKLVAGIETAAVAKIYQKAYAGEPFVHVMNNGVLPNTKYVRGSNHCMLGVKVNPRTNTLIMIAAIDNLVKGASGQAIQNMNIMLGFDETTGLKGLGLYP